MSNVKRNVTVWRPSVHLSVCLSRRHSHCDSPGDSMRRNKCRFRPDNKEDRLIYCKTFRYSVTRDLECWQEADAKVSKMRAVCRERQCLTSLAQLPRSTATAMHRELWRCRQLSTACDAWLDMTSRWIRSWFTPSYALLFWYCGNQQFQTSFMFLPHDRCFRAVRPSVRLFVHISEQILLSQYLMNGLRNLDESHVTYLVAFTDDVIRVWKSKVKVTAGRRSGSFYPTQLTVVCCCHRVVCSQYKSLFHAAAFLTLRIQQRLLGATCWRHRE